MQEYRKAISHIEINKKCLRVVFPKMNSGIFKTSRDDYSVLNIFVNPEY